MSEETKAILKIGQVDLSKLDVSSFPRTDPLNILKRPINGLNILTTRSTQQREFYGWQSPIDVHKDGSGIMFFMPYFMDHEEYLCTESERVSLELGGVYMLNDTVEHYTEGDGYTLALFCGSFKLNENNPELHERIVELFSFK